MVVRTFWLSQTIVLMLGVVILGVAVLGVPGVGLAIDPAKAPPEGGPANVPVTARGFEDRLNLIEGSLRSQGQPPLYTPRPPVVVLTESPTLFTTNAYDPSGVPYLAMVLRVWNTTSQTQSLDPAKLVLKADGKERRLADVPQSIRGSVVEVAGRHVGVDEYLPRRPINLAADSVTAVPVLFAPVEARGKVPALTLTYEIAGQSTTLDLNRLHRVLLDLDAIRIGPEGACGLITINGTLDGLNTLVLAERIRDLYGAGVRRFVVQFGRGAGVPSPMHLGWLGAMALRGELNEQYSMLPTLPTEVAELRFANLPVAVNRDFNDVNEVRDYQDVGQAVASVLWAPYRRASRAAVLRELDQGDPRGRAAALTCGGHLFQESDLPRLVRWLDDESSAVRDGAAAAIARFDRDDAREVLSKTVREGSPAASEAALLALLRARPAANVNAGISAAVGKTGMTEVVRLRALIESRHPAFYDQIREAARRGNVETRLLAISALGSSRHINARGVFEEAFASPDKPIRDAALNAAAARLEAGDHRLRSLVVNEALRRLTANPSDPVASEIAVQTRDPRFVGPMARRISAPGTSAGERRHLVEQLSQIGGMEVTEVFAEQFTRFSETEQETALSHLWREDPGRALPIAERLVTTGYSELAELAQQILIDDGSDQSVAVLRDAARKSTDGARGELMLALASIGSPLAYDALWDFREQGNESTRLAASRALDVLWEQSPVLEIVQTGNQRMGNQFPTPPADMAAAIALFNAAIEIDPLFPPAYQARGNARLRLGQWDQAAADFSAAIELDWYDDIALTGLCITWVMLGEEERAFDCLKAAERYFPNNVNYSYNSACTYSRALERLLQKPASPERDATATRLRDTAFRHLSASIDLGFDQLGLIESDPDLAALRDDPRFQSAVKKVREAL